VGQAIGSLGEKNESRIPLEEGEGIPESKAERNQKKQREKEEERDRFPPEGQLGSLKREGRTKKT